MLALLKASVGKKAVVAVTGALLYLFVIAHTLGNLQIFIGQEWLNAYAQHLKDWPFVLWPARAGLLAALVLHVAVSINLAAENRRARPIAYAKKRFVKASLASRTMIFSGLLIFAFIVYHLLHYTFHVTHPQYSGLIDAKGRHDVYSMVVLSFRELPVSAGYIAAMAALALHVGHGGQSLFQSLGFNDEKRLPLLEQASVAMGWIFFIGNASIPVAAWAGWIMLPPGVR